MKNIMCIKIQKIIAGFLFALLINLPAFAINEEAINLYNNGIELTGKEKYKEAAEKFQKALEKDPNFIDAYYNLGILYEFRGDDEKAVNIFSKALRLNPEDYEIMYKLAVINYNLENFEQAEEYMKKIPPENMNYKRLVEFMSDPSENVHNVNRNDLEVAVKEETEDDILNKMDGPKSCESIEKVISEIEGPTGLAKDSRGNIYVANFSEDSIVFIDTSGEKKVIARKGLIKGPIGLTIDKYNNLYVANYESDQIVLMPASGKEPKVLPVNVKKPYFLMVDKSGVLYVSEQGNKTVSKYKLIWENNK